MGVPKFYRWISERYPKINQIITDRALLPEFDHLYLDMNGIIHGCTHPPDLDAMAQQALSERDMMMGIMHYLDRIITQIVKPKVSVYMAIDGVAPRAKLNQQRSRRYRSARDMQEQQAAQAAAAPKPKDSNNNDENNKTLSAAFDSNCITPGTEFLHQVSELIRWFVQQKLRDDPTWRNLTVIFSGHDIPGEGEHKIMDHIRQLRSQPHYQPNTRHVIYGQDADLIMLGLVTHEPHFTILRETVNFNSFRNGDGNNALNQVKKFTKESDFQLLHLSVLREYLAIEFCFTTPSSSSSSEPSLNHPKKDDATTTTTTTTAPTFDLERCIDDFVFMTFLVGNDFLPHLPTLDIGDGAFDMLFSLYKQQRINWGRGNYLTDRGTISDPVRLQGFISAIGELEMDILAQKKKDEAVYMKKKRRWDKRDGKGPGPSDAELQAMEDERHMDYQTMIDTMLDQYGSNPDSFIDGWKQLLTITTTTTAPDDTAVAATTLAEENNTDANTNNNNNITTTTQEEEDVKARYYFEKLHLKPVDKDKHWQLRKSYMEGLMWCLAYYYKGCISWGWYYPYHYGPMLSDLTDIPQMFAQISFEMGQPLSPFEQLMACLPPGSVTLVPKLYRWLMTSPQSPIIAFYPEHFEVDMNGKKNPWEGVNLLPFIDVKVLKDTIAQHCPDHLLSAAERRRNTFGQVYAYRYDESCTDTVLAPIPNIGLVDLTPSCSKATVVQEPTTRSPPFQPRLIPGTQIPFPGFPSLNVLPIAGVEFVPLGLNCFGTPSKYPTCLLTLERMAEPAALPVLAKAVLGKSLFVNWPMMHEGKAVAISDATQEIRLLKGGQTRAKPHTEALAERWRSETEAMQQMYYVGDGVPGSGGVQIGEVRIRIKVLPLQGTKTNPSNGSTKKVFGREEADVPLQLALGQAPAPDPRFKERGPLTLNDRFPIRSRVILTKGKYRGCLGQVVGLVDKKTVGVSVQTLPAEPPFGLALARAAQESYVTSNDAARILRIHPGVLGKVAGRLQFEQGRYDLGLNLKSADGMCVVGYTRRKGESNNNDASNNNNNNSIKKSSWAVGDGLRIVGSRPGANDGTGEDRILWEYAPKAIRLIEAYRAKFPQLFAGLAQLPNEKKYDANAIFGNGGEKWLPVVREWLNNLESAKLPRSPVTTQSMSYEAVAAVQKASAVRSLALKKKGFPKESIIKIPGAALYREGSTGATDVLLASDLNHGDESPNLGDRIINLAADGIPFGLRGTVVAIHEASSTTGSVEVVMDEEFMGGSTLQGLCSKFRGKLCLWSRLLKVAPDDAKSMVDRMIPKGSAKGAVIDKIIASLDPTAGSGRANNAAVAASAASSNNRNASSATTATGTAPAANPAVSRNKKQQQPQQSPRQKQQQPSVLLNPTRAAATVPPSNPAAPGVSTTSASSSHNRSGSSQKGRQGGWREARGPDGNDVGFKWKGKGRKGKATGVMRWRSVIDANRNNPSALLKTKLGIGDNKRVDAAAAAAFSTLAVSAPPSLASASVSVVDSAAEKLKVVLGVSGGNKAAAPGTTAIEGTANNNLEAVSNLKSMLGVTSTKTTTSKSQLTAQAAPFEPPASSAEVAALDTAQLKEVLGVGGPQTPVPSAPAQAPPTDKAADTAANRLLQMMVNSQIQQQHHHHQPMQLPPQHVGGGGPMYHPVNHHSGFNFTFSTAGGQQPPPVTAPVPHHHPMFVHAHPPAGPYHPHPSSMHPHYYVAGTPQPPPPRQHEFRPIAYPSSVAPQEYVNSGNATDSTNGEPEEGRE
ncbi:hypothetical protein ACA910_019310 [Epithemia clementina (nom. ined.)]